eukprot:TRINITY_DN9509_c0_g2_i1.p1 TRINITY_DN9509_c0_g2~~TRINITY_DN9509_c0_g2_i1.p1  ORF type:complete len:161 (-),score=30.81 TRINITY_DN9509_c0_g2_i1:268-750(-)
MGSNGGTRSAHFRNRSISRDVISTATRRSVKGTPATRTEEQPPASRHSCKLCSRSFSTRCVIKSSSSSSSPPPKVGIVADVATRWILGPAVPTVLRDSRCVTLWPAALLTLRSLRLGAQPPSVQSSGADSGGTVDRPPPAGELGPLSSNPFDTAGSGCDS